MERLIVSPKISSLAFDEVKDEPAPDEFVPELNVIVNPRHKVNNASFIAAETKILLSAVEVKGMFTVSF